MNTRVIATLLAIGLSIVAVVVGVRTGNKVLDTDEALYQRTLRSMRAGEGYYRAMSDALAVKEGAHPSSVRAIRPPTMFIILRWFPERSWRWIVGIVFLAIMLAMARIAEPYGALGPVAAVLLGGVWMIGASSYLYLHAELWGLPFFLFGVAFARRREGISAASIALATAFRELYALGLLFGLFVGKDRKKWATAGLVVAALAIVHIAFAHTVLERTGHQVALGNESLNLHSILRFISPGDRPVAFVIGITVLALGLVGLMGNLDDRSARIVLPFTLVLLPAAIIATRSYWNLTYGPALASFVPAGLLQLKHAAEKIG